MARLQARLLLYAAIVLGVGSAALYNLFAAFTAYGRYSCGGDWLCPFNDPLHGLLWWLALGGAGAAEALRSQYSELHGPALLALPLLALCARRAWALLRTRSPAVPPHFAGLPLALAVGGAALYLVGDRIWLLLPYPMLDPPRILGGFCMVLAFVGTELADLLAARTARLPAPTTQPTVAARTGTRRRPVWSIAAVALPPALVLLSFGLAALVPAGGGGWGLFPIALVICGIVGGLALGAVATVVAAMRREPWPALQVAGFFLNFGVGLPLLLKAVQ